jgi:hypothetical protein
MSDPASDDGPRRNHFVPSFRPGRIREARFRDMAVRFAFGGTISVVAALVGAVTTESIGESSPPSRRYWWQVSR